MEIKKSYYAIIPASVRYDQNLPANAKLLYGEITALCNQSGLCWAQNSYFAELYGVDEKTVRRWLNALIEAGYIRRNVQYDNDGKTIIQRCLSIAEMPLGGGDKNVRPGQKCPQGTDKNVPRGGDKNVRDNNTSKNNTSEYNPPTPLTAKERMDVTVAESTLPDKVKQALTSWLAYKKHAYKDEGLKALLTIVTKKVQTHGETAVCDLIEECMSNTWQGIIWDKLDQRTKRAQPPTQQGKYPTSDELNAYFNQMTEDDV